MPSVGTREALLGGSPDRPPAGHGAPGGPDLEGQTHMGTAIRTLFTVEEANQVLPLVRSIVRDVVDDFRELRSAGHAHPRVLVPWERSTCVESAAGKRLLECAAEGIWLRCAGFPVGTTG